MLPKKYIDINLINNNPNLSINIIFAFFPISMVCGNFIVNLNFLLFTIFGIVILKLKILKEKLDLPFKIIFLFFCFIIFSTFVSLIIHFYNEESDYVDLNNLIKSIIFFRFFIILIIICLLNKMNILNFKYFVYVGTILTILISLDVIFQYSFGFNIIGLPSTDYHNSSFFGDELIAGGFILRFSIFTLLFSIFLINKNKSINFFTITFLICLLGMGILLSGNRMPLIFYFFALFLLLFFNRNLRKYFITGLLAFGVIFLVFISFDETYKKNYKSIYASTINIGNLIISPLNKKSINNENQNINKIEFGAIVPKYESAQRRLFLTAIDTWKFNKMSGNGFKSFRKVCQKLDEKFNMQEDMQVYYIPHEASYEENRLCANHPHNYYFEILTEFGIIGILIVFIIMFLFLFFLFKNLKLFNKQKLDFIILSAAILSLILEMFPIKSTGSLVTSSNATYIILLASIVLCNKKILKM